MSNPGQDLSRRQQLTQSYRMAKQSDPRIGLWIAGAFLLGAVVGGVLFWLIPPRGGVFDWIMTALGALMVGLLGALLVFSRRAQEAAYTQLEGRPGGAAAALTMLKRGWKVDPVVAFTKQQDIVHRVVGRPGIVLVGEGSANRLHHLLTAEKRKYERVCADTPVTDLVVGDGEGQVPIRKLNKVILKLPKGMEPSEMTDVLNRLKAIDAQRSNVPLPKGPVPTSMKGLRGQMRGK